MKALFICDNKEEWNLLTNLFHAHFSSVDLTCVQKGQDALDTLMFDANFNMILIECSLKETNPTHLAENIYDTIGPRPLIFIGTEAMVKDRVDDNFFNAHDVISIYHKPYEPQELVEVINEAIGWSKQQEFEDSIVEIQPEDLLPLKLRNFYLYDQVPFDVYIELTKTKYLKAISANKKYPQSTIQDFRKRNIKFLYLEKNEHLKFLENSIAKISQSFHQIRSEDSQRRMQTLIAATLVSHQYIRDVGVSDTLKGFVDLIIEQISKTFEEHNSLTDILLNFPLEHGDLAEQAVLKALMCEYMVRALGWKSDSTRAKTSLASLLHDSFLEREEWAVITYKDHPHLDDIEKVSRENFINHPLKAAETAHFFTQYPDVDFIIEQHHEQPDGTGFPRGISTGKITKLSAIFILANNFVIQLVINGVTRSTIRNICQSFEGLYNVGNFKEPFNELLKELKRK